jgi:hypothetical protein
VCAKCFSCFSDGFQRGEAALNHKGTVWTRGLVGAFMMVALFFAGCAGKDTECEGGVCRDAARPDDIVLANTPRTVDHPDGTESWFGLPTTFLPAAGMEPIGGARFAFHGTDPGPHALRISGVGAPALLHAMIMLED